MNMKPFVFEASWDDEAKVWWISKTPIPELVTEASTIDELYNKLSILIPEMLETENAESPLPIQVTSFRECVPV